MTPSRYASPSAPDPAQYDHNGTPHMPAKTNLMLEKADALYLAKFVRGLADDTQRLAYSLETVAQALESRLKR